MDDPLTRKTGFEEDRETGDSNKLKVIVLAISVVVIFSFIALLAIGLLNRSSVTGLSGFTRVGKLAPTFTAEDFDGEIFDLSEHIGQPIVINFWASWCAPCRDEAPLLESAWRYHRDQDVLFLGVNMQDDEAVGREYIDAFGVTYPNVRDVDGRVTVEYGVIGIPVTFFVNRQGIVERRFVGALSDDLFLKWVDELAAGVSPSGAAEEQNLEGFQTLN